MRLRDDEMAGFVRHSEKYLINVETLAEAHGVKFTCPCGGGHGIIVWFADRDVPADATPLYRWKATGTSLADLTLTPSVNASCWHGFVTNGVAA